MTDSREGMMAKTDRPARRRSGAFRPTFDGLEPRALLSRARPALATAEVVAAAGSLRVVKRVSDRVYSRDGSKLDVYTPAGARPPKGGWPVIIALPGGGWRWASKDDYGRAIAGLGKYGYAAVAAEYAFNSPGGRSTWPANIEDVRIAIRWVRKNAARFQINPNKVVAMGESAGGHLAALAAVLPDGPVGSEGANPAASRTVRGQLSARVQAAVVFYGPSDLLAEWDQQPEVRPYLTSFLGGSPDRMPGRYLAASPIAHVSPDDPPVFIVQGTADKVVDTSQSTNFAQALRDAGVPVSVTLLPGVPHGFRFAIRSENMKNVVRFLNRALGG